MPYIKRDDKKRNLQMILESLGTMVEVKGELTYCIYKLGLEYMKYHKKNYQNLSDVCAAMHDAEQEFRRRRLVPYEDEKIKSNGDVY